MYDTYIRTHTHVRHLRTYTCTYKFTCACATALHCIRTTHFQLHMKHITLPTCPFLVLFLFTHRRRLGRQQDVSRAEALFFCFFFFFFNSTKHLKRKLHTYKYARAHVNAWPVARTNNRGSPHISYLLLYPSLWLLVPGPSSHITTYKPALMLAKLLMKQPMKTCSPSCMMIYICFVSFGNCLSDIPTKMLISNQNARSFCSVSKILL